MPNVALRVRGKEYRGWKSVRVTRSIESVSGTFELSVSERWAESSAPWPILEEDECVLLIGGETVITGYVEQREPAFSPSDHSLTVGGRDRTGDLVDSSAVLPEWEFKNVPILSFARRIAQPFGVSVSLQAGFPPPSANLSIDPGDTAFEAIERACRSAALLPVADGRGGLVLMRPGSARTHTALVEGQNLVGGSARYDATGRFRRYLVRGQHQGTDELFADSAASVSASAEDANVRRAGTCQRE
jgi:prophage tail gpP-like protein